MENDSLRDYSLTGVESARAIELGLADAEWYQSPVPREKMRELLVRRDGPAIRDTLLWLSMIIGSGVLVFLWWGSWLAIIPYIVYSVLYASTSDSRWHESSHGTAFKTDWMNNVLYEIASFMVVRQSTVWRWSHARHHSDTIIRGRDPEIAVPRPPRIRKIPLFFVGLAGAIPEFRRMFIHASGRIDPGVATYLPVSEFPKVILKARIYLSVYLVVIILSVVFQSILPLMYIGIPTILGSWLMPVYGLTQHAGLQENVLDHRLNCRTVYMNRIHRYLYWNMNYHVEHHMFPLVPYHALPKLHELIKPDCPPPYTSLINAYREIIPALLRQSKDPSFYVERSLPQQAAATAETAKPVFTGSAETLADNKIEVCHSDELPAGEVIRFDFNQKTYAVYRTADDGLYATEGICTHGNAHLADGLVIGDLIECQKHNGRFSIKDGSPRRIPVCRGVRTFPVLLKDGKVYLDLSDSKANGLKPEDQQRVFRVSGNRNVTAFIRELVLEPADGVPFDYKPGQYIQLVIPPFAAGFENFSLDESYRKRWDEMNLLGLRAQNSIYSKRNYSMATNPATDKYLKFNVRIALPPEGQPVAPGIGSTYVFNLKTGDEVTVEGPFGDFLVRDSDREMVYLGGGAGMAPLRSHLSYLLETLRTKRKISFWYGARSLDDLFYLDYFEALEKAHENFSFTVALSEPQIADGWTGQIGFITDVFQKHFLAEHQHPQEVEYYLCGPPAMIRAGITLLNTLGVPEERIAFDEF
jgi:Na+-transporting NADH:ubiquinone oxidoreductase subunit F